jgi:Pin2-interacting protein X1
VTEDKVEVVSAEWWGYKYGFISGGFLGAKSSRKKSLMTEEAQTHNERTVFFEDDQENLYNLVQVCNLFFQTLSLQHVTYSFTP